MKLLLCFFLTTLVAFVANTAADSSMETSRQTAVLSEADSASLVRTPPAGYAKDKQNLRSTDKKAATEDEERMISLAAVLHAWEAIQKFGLAMCTAMVSTTTHIMMNRYPQETERFLNYWFEGMYLSGYTDKAVADVFEDIAISELFVEKYKIFFHEREAKRKGDRLIAEIEKEKAALKTAVANNNKNNKKKKNKQAAQNAAASTSTQANSKNKPGRIQP